MLLMDDNIEFAHIYADEEPGEEQTESAKILKKRIIKLNRENNAFVISILIDDYHPSVHRLDENKMIADFNKKGTEVDFLGYESGFKSTAHNLIRELPRNLLKTELFRHPEREILLLEEFHAKDMHKIGLEEDHKTRHHFTCALLSASWALCRLGIFMPPKGAIRNLTRRNFPAKKILTILPEKYREVEHKALDIIGSTKFKKVLPRIEYEFF